MERHKLLRSWIIQMIVEKPELITKMTTATNFYAEFVNEFCIDVQKATKEIILECAPKELLNKMTDYDLPDDVSEKEYECSRCKGYGLIKIGKTKITCPKCDGAGYIAELIEPEEYDPTEEESKLDLDDDGNFSPVNW